MDGPKVPMDALLDRASRLIYQHTGQKFYAAGPMKVWHVWAWAQEDRYLAATFAAKDVADAFAANGKGREVEEAEVLDAAPTPWTYYVRGAEVYPDKAVQRWTEKHVEDSPECSVQVLEDDEPFDGHMQGHCGEHIYISGTDKKAVDVAFRRHVAEAVARQDGACHSPHHKHRGDVDGRTIYETGFWGEVRRTGAKRQEKMACLDHFEHRWDDIGETKSCLNGCGAFRVTVSAHFTIPPLEPSADEKTP